ncbi:MAG: MoxR family ATPase [Verrucomicrobia bacterium]|nr:MoxR family ATPase [Verrucomicrobiota bacterium]
MSCKQKKTAAPALQPDTRSFLTRPLGLEGWSHLEPIVLAALISEDPLLLIGTHGTAKSFLLQRLAEALGLTFRFYNTSLINFDDLVGIPFPVDNNTRLEYIATSAAIWDAEVVFMDELSRARPELQNKIFPIIHERRIQGIALDKLRYRWSAMNPPPVHEDDSEPRYLGAEPLDPALADRFAYIVDVPDWYSLTEQEQRAVLCDQFRGRHEFPVPIRELVSRGKRVLGGLQDNVPPQLADYLIALASQSRRAGHPLSSRRVTMLHRSILAVQSARVVLHDAAGACRPDWEDAAWLAYRYGLPGFADGAKTDIETLLAAHRQAWRLCGLDANDPWRALLGEPDAIKRLALACRIGSAIDDADYTGLISQALSVYDDPAARRALALVTYLRLRDETQLPAISVETLAGEIGGALSASNKEVLVYGQQLKDCREASAICASFPEDSSSVRDAHCRNLLHSLLPDGFVSRQPAEVAQLFNRFWKQFGLEAEHA